jgi:hypothetical protein
MKQTATEWLIDEAMKLVVQYMQGTLNEDTLDDVIYEIGTKAKEMEKEQIIDAFEMGQINVYENHDIDSDDYYQLNF